MNSAEEFEYVYNYFNKLDRIAFAPYRTGAPYPPPPASLRPLTLGKDGHALR
jgi:hypothetical protein